MSLNLDYANLYTLSSIYTTYPYMDLHIKPIDLACALYLRPLSSQLLLIWLKPRAVLYLNISWIPSYYLWLLNLIIINSVCAMLNNHIYFVTERPHFEQSRSLCTYANIIAYFDH